MHEASLHEDNCFITLTFSDEYLPHDMSVNVRHWQLFMKRLKKNYKGKQIRFFHCGEYGEINQRPHYHAILFGHDFEDKQLWSIKNENKTYTSERLNKSWPFGFALIGSVTFQSAAYVARYVMKKRTGNNAESHYQYVNQDGEVFQRRPEYTTMSRRPGIGAAWLARFKGDVFPSDQVIMNGQAMQPPKYYDRQFEVENPNGFRRVRAKRKAGSKRFADDQTRERLEVREKVKIARISQLKREL